MRMIFIIVRKELLQVFRNKAMLPILTIIPVVQLILLSFAASNEIRNVSLAVFDGDHSRSSRLLLDKFTASDLFVLKAFPVNYEKAKDLLQSDDADIVLLIPPGFERNLMRNSSETLQLLVNAINGQKGGLGAAYAAAVIQDFNKEIIDEMAPALVSRMVMTPQMEIVYANWYNPTLDYKVFMVPGILGVLVIILTLLLSAMNVVREREIGTIEQLNVTPVKKYQFIAGKLIPFLLIGLFDLVIGLAIGELLFNIPIVGSLWLIFAFCVIDLVFVLSIGLLISSVSDTQQQAMFIAWFFMMIFILMSGLFTPIESMPQWAQHLTIPNPIAHFVEVMRQILLKGSNFQDIKEHFMIVGALAVLFSILASLSYRKAT